MKVIPRGSEWRLKVVVEAERQVIYQADSQSRLEFRVLEFFFAVPVAEEPYKCSDAEVVIYGVAYARLCSYAQTVARLGVVRVDVTELEGSLPKEVEIVE